MNASALFTIRVPETEDNHKMPPPSSPDQDAPWKKRFRIPRMNFSQIASECPSRGIISSNRDGIYQIYAWDTLSGNLSLKTTAPVGLKDAYLTPNGKHFFYLKDEKGNEKGHWVRQSYDSGQVDDVTPSLPAYTSWGFSISRSGHTLALLATFGNFTHLFIVEEANDGTFLQPRLLSRVGSLALEPRISNSENIVVYANNELTGTPDTGLLAIDTSSGKTLATLSHKSGRALPVAFSPLDSDNRLLAVATINGYERPLIWDPLSEEQELIELQELEGDVIAASWFPTGDQLLLVHTVAATQRLYTYNLLDNKLTKLDHISGTFYAGGDPSKRLYFEPKNGNLIALTESFQRPRQIVEIDRKTWSISSVLISPTSTSENKNWTSVTFRSLDNTEIQAWLALPDGHGPFATIIHLHGGPEYAVMDTYMPFAHLWLDHGFAFLSVNYRGSTTFGQDFLKEIWHQPGKLEVEDIVAATEYLVANGFADPSRILLAGWSYGAYLALYGLSLEPELWAGGIAVAPITDWTMQYEDEADTLRLYDIALLGGTPSEKKEIYTTASPMNYVSMVSKPILIIQGKNDSRTPPRQIIEYEKRMKGSGKDIKVIWFDGGHQSLDVEETLSHYEAMLTFASNLLKGVP